MSINLEKWERMTYKSGGDDGDHNDGEILVDH